MPKRKREEEGEGVISDLYQRARSALLNKPTASFSKFLAAHGNEPIGSLEVVRTPLKAALNAALNLATVGKFNKNKKKYNYPEVYHLYFVINGRWRVEKNHVVEAKPWKPEGDMEAEFVPYAPAYGSNRLKIADLIKPSGPSYWLYSAVYNCQNFVLRNLESAGLLTPKLRAFIFQDPLKLLEGSNPDNLSVVTDLAAAAAHYTPWPIRKLAGGRVANSHAKRTGALMRKHRISLAEASRRAATQRVRRRVRR